eukprot:TRINITY_DN16058_c0_g1_i1.p2 TRINITY_DN16058_c0_g1~~TRINITY_DN16058_c0_g1_i1.p2  ORF type:complete len:222 (+),score=14.76 TRINITY_DN16058_c0_g1_i1:52-666(+)
MFHVLLARLHGVVRASARYFVALLILAISMLVRSSAYRSSRTASRAPQHLFKLEGVDNNANEPRTLCFDLQILDSKEESGRYYQGQLWEKGKDNTCQVHKLACPQIVGSDSIDCFWDVGGGRRDTLVWGSNAPAFRNDTELQKKEREHTTVDYVGYQRGGDYIVLYPTKLEEQIQSADLCCGDQTLAAFTAQANAQAAGGCTIS